MKMYEGQRVGKRGERENVTDFFHLHKYSMSWVFLNENNE